MTSGLPECSPDKLIVVGKLGAAWGILGWLRLFSYTGVEHDIFNYRPWLVRSAGEWISVLPEKWRVGGKCGLLVLMRGISDRTTAGRLTNSALFVRRVQLPAPEAGEYYWDDVIGCQVVDVSGDLLGDVIQIISAKVHDVLVVRNGDVELLVPFLRGTVVKSVDVGRRILTVDWSVVRCGG